jgi:AP-1 complex subunit gamma-1
VSPILTSAFDGSSSVSEKRNVGSTRADKDSLVDLLGDDGQQTHEDAGNEANAHDLLADIFGIGGSSTATTPKPTPSKPVDDIMSLFGNNVSKSARSGLSDDPLVGNPAVQSQQTTGNVRTADRVAETSMAQNTLTSAATAPRSVLQQYTAYEKNGLKITLTPKTNPSQPGMVQILVRFTSSASDTLENVNFQAAVPKVRHPRSYY